MPDTLSKQGDKLIGSDAKQGIAALVPRRSLTITVIIGSEDWTGAAAAFFFFFLSRRASSSGRVRSRSLSLCLPWLRSSLSLRGDRPRSSLSLYPRSSRRSSRPGLSSSRLLSFHRKPPPDFLGRSRSLSLSILRSGDRLLARSSIVNRAKRIVVSQAVQVMPHDWRRCPNRLSTWDILPFYFHTAFTAH